MTADEEELRRQAETDAARFAGIGAFAVIGAVGFVGAMVVIHILGWLGL